MSVGQSITYLITAAKLPENLWTSKRLRQHILIIGVLLAAAWWGPRASQPMVVIMYGAIAAAILLRWPGLGLPGLLLAAAFVPIEIGTGTGSSINVAMLGVAGLTVLWLVPMVLSHQVRLHPSESNRPWIVLVLVAALSIIAGSALWNPWVITKTNFFVVQLGQWSIFVLSACAFWLTGHLTTSRRDLAILVTVLLVLGAIHALGGVMPWFGYASHWLLFNSAVFRIWVVALATSFAVFHDGLSRKARVLLLILALLVVYVGYGLSGSWASGWLPAIFVLGTVIAIRMGRGFRPASAVVAAPGLLLLLMVIPKLATSERWSFETRVIAWRGLLGMMADRWLFGLGLASYWHYWRDVVGSISYLDPTTGYLHYSYDPKVNMHNNYIDIFGQMGVIGVLALGWLIVALYFHARRVFREEPEGFGRAYSVACIAGLTGMLAAGMLGDWFFPFVYNIGLSGFRDSLIGWLFLGGLVVLDVTRRSSDSESDAPATPT